MINVNHYMGFVNRCGKYVWINNNDKSKLDASNNEYILEEAKQIKLLGRELIENGTEIDNTEDKDTRALKTSELLKPGSIMYNPTFIYNDILISVDMVRVSTKRKLEIYLTKSATSIKSRYKKEAAFKYNVLSKLGYDIEKVYIAYVNKEYVRGEELVVSDLFKVEDIKEEVVELELNVDDELNQLREYMNSKVEPEIDIDEFCLKIDKDDMTCECKNYCWRHIPENSVFDINGTYLKSNRKFKLYRDGIITFEQLSKVKKLSDNARMQINCEMNDEVIVNKKEIKEFINNLEYPLYFLDFETYKLAIPPYEGIRSHQQVPFQYSLHYIEYEGAELEHREYLAKEGVNSLREFAERLVEDISDKGSIVVYNQTFEKSRISELAQMYPDLEEKLIKINDNIVDMMVIFSEKHYYKKEMKGSYSIKYVLPALCPDDKDLDYKSLNIQNGAMAMNIFPTLHLKSDSEINQIRADLLAYCNLDTLAMVKLLEKLKDITNCGME